jgi:hypothetical protein
MAEFPPKIDVVDEATTRQVAEWFRKGATDGAHQAELLGTKFGQSVVATLTHWGLDQPSNRFGFGSTAKKVAKEQDIALKQVADHLKSAAYYIDAWRLIVDGKFWTPVRMAEAASKSGNNPNVLVRR